MKSVYQATKQWAEQRKIAVIAFDEIGSTNDEAKGEAFDVGDDPVLYLTAHQTHGHGRGKNTWLDTGAGENLLSSWSFHLEDPPQAVTGPRVGEALFRSIHAVWPAHEWSIKPPNDLYLGAKKIAGLLVESLSQGGFHRLVIGLGMNVLNHPRAIGNATHFTAANETQISEGEWYRFLDMLFTNFRQAADESVSATLSQDVRTSLLQALNANPTKKEPYVEVSPNGDLTTRSAKIPWTEQ